MDQLRLVTLAVLFVAAVVVACSEIEAPTEIVAAASITQGEACAEWSCSEYVCGHPTSPPYHPCCIRSVYDPPCDYQEPCPEADEPVCEACNGCNLADNECWWSGNTCHFDEHFPCLECCDPEASCHDDPVTQGVCEARDSYLWSLGSYCFSHQAACEDYCRYGAF